MLGSLVGSGLERGQRLAAAWFGPKGFASVVYALIVLDSGIPQTQQVVAVIVATVAISIAVHSTTDVPVAKLLRPSDREPGDPVVTPATTDPADRADAAHPVDDPPPAGPDR